MPAIVTIRINFPENDLNYGWVFDKAKSLECFIHNSLAKECVSHGHGATEFSVTSETIAITPYKEIDVQSITGAGSNAAKSGNRTATGIEALKQHVHAAQQ